MININYNNAKSNPNKKRKKKKKKRKYKIYFMKTNDGKDVDKSSSLRQIHNSNNNNILLNNKKKKNIEISLCKEKYNDYKLNDLDYNLL